jgi:hypothetical protein
MVKDVSVIISTALKAQMGRFAMVGMRERERVGNSLQLRPRYVPAALSLEEGGAIFQVT